MPTFKKNKIFSKKTDFLAETKASIAKICPKYQTAFESVCEFDPKNDTLADLFMTYLEGLYGLDFGYGSFKKSRDMQILMIAADCLMTQRKILNVSISTNSSQITIQNDSIKNPGILTLTANGKWIFSVGELTYPQFSVDEIFDKKKGEFIMKQILMASNMKKTN